MMNIAYAARYPADLPYLRPPDLPYVAAGINFATLYANRGNGRTRLYIVQAAPPRGPFKIGVGVDPDARVKALQIGCPDPLRLIAHIPATVTIERALHAALAEHRKQGEWFEAAPAVLEVVSEVFEIALMIEDYAQDGMDVGLHDLAEIMADAYEFHGAS